MMLTCSLFCNQLDWGLKIENIKLLVLLGSKPGLDKVAEECPGLEIYVGGVDNEVRPSFY